MRSRFPLLPRILFCAVLAACTGEEAALSARLAPADVAGTYLVCELRFTPSHRALPAADVLASVMDAAAEPRPALRLLGDGPEFELWYVRRKDGALQRLRGDVEFGTGSVFLYPHSRLPSLIPFETLLPPGHLDLVFHPGDGRLTAGVEVSAYSVSRGDYASAAGVPADGLQGRITGHITAAFARDGCAG